MSLTDDWKAGKLDTTQRYWIIEKGFSKPIPRLMNELGEFIDNFGYPINGKGVKEVLAPCDYDHFVELTEKVKTLEKEVVKGEIIIGKMLNESNAVAEENKQLCDLLRECQAHLSFGEIGTSVTPLNRLLTRINAAIGESEE